ncbi:MAG: hypothetical protein H6512_04810 [Acidimicrobiia bacterium]|nr:hypothetical protein [Acidimicrobiia bacterium]
MRPTFVPFEASGIGGRERTNAALEAGAHAPRHVFCVVALSTGLTIWFARSAAEDQAKNELTNRIAALDDRVEYELALRDEQGLNTGAATALCGADHGPMLPGQFHC